MEKPLIQHQDSKSTWKILFTFLVSISFLTVSYVLMQSHNESFPEENVGAIPPETTGAYEGPSLKVIHFTCAGEVADIVKTVADAVVPYIVPFGFVLEKPTIASCSDFKVMAPAKDKAESQSISASKGMRFLLSMNYDGLTITYKEYQCAAPGCAVEAGSFFPSQSVSVPQNPMRLARQAEKVRKSNSAAAEEKMVCGLKDTAIRALEQRPPDDKDPCVTYLFNIDDSIAVVPKSISEHQKVCRAAGEGDVDTIGDECTPSECCEWKSNARSS